MTIEQVIARIERARSIYENAIDSDIVKGRVAMCNDIVDTLRLETEFHPKQEQQELPEGLEEAAEEWCKRNNKGIALSYDGSHYLAEGIDAFISGAKWQKNKIMEKAVDGKVIKSYNPVTAIGQPTLHGIELIYPDKDKPYLIAGDTVKVIIIPE